jgi:hypothetical protein
MRLHSVEPTNALSRPCVASTWFADHFGVPLPRGLREQADEMSWERFVAAYGDSCGPLRLGQWACTDVARPAARLGPQARTYQATIAVGDRLGMATAAGSGPVAALTVMLYDRGIAVEMLKFHQMNSDDYTATFIRGSDGVRTAWGMGWAQDPTQSALHAVIACANRLVVQA